MGMQDVMADASLLLLVGGLSMLGLIMVLVALQSLFPDKPRSGGPEPEAHRARQLRPLRETSPLFAETRRSARPGPFRRETYTTPVDVALATVVERQLGEPRLLRTRPEGSRVRLYRCRGCEADGATGCVFERATLEEAFRSHVGPAARVQEVLCRAGGSEHCEFEVAH